MSIYALKPAFQNLLRPLVRLLALRGVSANAITILATIISAIAGGVIFLQSAGPRIFLVVPIVMLLRMALNAIDGMLAREHGMKSNLGAFLNELSDVFSDIFLFLPFVNLPDVAPGIVVGFVLGAVLTEFSGVLAAQIGASRRYDGPFGKSDRAFVIGILSLLHYFGAVKPWQWTPIFMVLCLLTLVTIARRVRNGLKEIAK